MSRDELDIMRQIVEMSIQNTDEYINMTFSEMIRKENDDQNRSNRRPCENMV